MWKLSSELITDIDEANRAAAGWHNTSSVFWSSGTFPHCSANICSYLSQLPIFANKIRQKILYKMKTCTFGTFYDPIPIFKRAIFKHTNFQTYQILNSAIFKSAIFKHFLKFTLTTPLECLTLLRVTNSHWNSRGLDFKSTMSSYLSGSQHYKSGLFSFSVVLSAIQTFWHQG